MLYPLIISIITSVLIMNFYSTNNVETQNTSDTVKSEILKLKKIENQDKEILTATSLFIKDNSNVVYENFKTSDKFTISLNDITNYLPRNIEINNLENIILDNSNQKININRTFASSDDALKYRKFNTKNTQISNNSVESKFDFNNIIKISLEKEKSNETESECYHIHKKIISCLNQNMSNKTLCFNDVPKLKKKIYKDEKIIKNIKNLSNRKISSINILVNKKEDFVNAYKKRYMN